MAGIGTSLLMSCANIGERDNINDPGAILDNDRRHSSSSMAKSSSSRDLTEYSSHVDPSTYFPSSSSKTTADDYLNPDFDYGEFLDERDNRLYKTTKVGNQTWMAQNLNYSDSVATPNLKGQSWCYNHDEARCRIYGRLYTWAAAMDLDSTYNRYYYGVKDSLHYRGICPEGWRIPTADDLHELFVYTDKVCSEAYPDVYLDVCWRTTDGWNEKFSDSLGVDLFGLSVLPSGERFIQESYSKGKEYVFRYQEELDHNNRTSFFSSTEDRSRLIRYDDSTAYVNRVFANDVGLYHFDDLDTLGRWKTTASAIRCIKIED